MYCMCQESSKPNAITVRSANDELIEGTPELVITVNK